MHKRRHGVLLDGGVEGLLEAADDLRTHVLAIARGHELDALAKAREAPPFPKFPDDVRAPSAMVVKRVQNGPPYAEGDGEDGIRHT